MDVLKHTGLLLHPVHILGGWIWNCHNGTEENDNMPANQGNPSVQGLQYGDRV